MSDFSQAFAISASGMSLERLRLEVAATNIANMHALEGANGRSYVPRKVTATAAAPFDTVLEGFSSGAAAVGQVSVAPVPSVPPVELDPGNPFADSRGIVSKSAVNPLEEMITLSTAVRAYEANVRAFSAAKAMAARALDLGGG